MQKYSFSVLLEMNQKSQQQGGEMMGFPLSERFQLYYLKLNQCAEMDGRKGVIGVVNQNVQLDFLFSYTDSLWCYFSLLYFLLNDA